MPGSGAPSAARPRTPTKPTLAQRRKTFPNARRAGCGDTTRRRVLQDGGGRRGGAEAGAGGGGPVPAVILAPVVPVLATPVESAALTAPAVPVAVLAAAAEHSRRARPSPPLPSLPALLQSTHATMPPPPALLGRDPRPPTDTRPGHNLHAMPARTSP
jgi:hypothetical protein